MELPKRKQNRLKNYDYSQNGGYFITVCTHEKKHILAEVTRVGEGSPLLQLTDYGKIADKYIRMITSKYPVINIENFVVMPNHIHILAVIYNEPYGTGNPSPTISSAIAWFKYQTTKEINLLRKSPGARVWQRSFHDHIVRGQQDYEEIWQYIDENPLRWDSDCYY